MARISLNPRRTLALRLAEWWMRRSFGQVMDPARALGHHPRLLRHYMTFQSRVVGWKELDMSTKCLAQMAAVAKIGCPWCLDFGYWACEKFGVPLDKVGKVPQWRRHPEAFTEVERLAMEYAEAMCGTPPTVTDELVQALLDRLGEAAFVELTTVIAVEDSRARLNIAMGLTSQGFADSCAVPPPAIGSAS